MESAGGFGHVGYIKHTHIMSTVVVAIRVQYNGQPVEVVLASEHGAGLHAVPHVPDRETVSEEVLAAAVHLELHLQLPVAGVAWLKNKNREPSSIT